MDVYNNDKQSAFVARFAHKMKVPAQLLEQFVKEYNDLQVVYRSAIREVSTRLEVLDDEFSFRHRRNPIHSIQTRLKTPQSMMEKLGRRGLSPSIDIIRTELTDVAGIRVICSYVDDIYRIAGLLCAQDGVQCVDTQDFIKNPKPSGYRSLHLVVRVPVRFSNGQQQVPVEIQIRTIAMDFWASLEHELRYKSDTPITREAARELKEIAESITLLDERMQAVYQTLEQVESRNGNGENGSPAAEKTAAIKAKPPNRHGGCA